MVSEMKVNERAFMFWPVEWQIWAKQNWKSMQVLCADGVLEDTINASFLKNGTYRLSLNFQLPEPSIKAPAGYRIVSMKDRARCKFPVDCVVKYTCCGNDGWVNPDYKDWRNDEPDRHYAVPADYVFAEDRPKPSPKFVEYPIFDDYGWSCSVEHLRKRDESVLYSLHELPSIVGFTGDILFRYSDGTEQWRYTLTDRSRGGTPAIPIKARFYINGETK
jgi:hypothetical protein